MQIKQERMCIDGIPAILYGNAADAVYLFVHGKCGCKEEAEDFAQFACPKSWQVLAIDLPGHGERQDEKDKFDPWHAVPELQWIMDWLRGRWPRVSLRANSIGAWFSMLSFSDVPIEKCLFVSPILDMERLIGGMMLASGVSEARLREAGEIPTDFGETLSWQYLTFVREHPIRVWTPPTELLYAGQDNLTDRTTVESFAERFRCGLTVMENGEHWFHTPEQMDVLHHWISEKL